MAFFGVFLVRFNMKKNRNVFVIYSVLKELFRAKNICWNFLKLGNVIKSGTKGINNDLFKQFKLFKKTQFETLLFSWSHFFRIFGSGKLILI